MCSLLAVSHTTSPPHQGSSGTEWECILRHLRCTGGSRTSICGAAVYLHTVQWKTSVCGGELTLIPPVSLLMGKGVGFMPDQCQVLGDGAAPATITGGV